MFIGFETKCEHRDGIQKQVTVVKIFANSAESAGQR